MRLITVMTLGFLLALGAVGSFAEEGDHAGHEVQSDSHQDMSGSHSGMGHGMGGMGAQMGHSAVQHDTCMHDMHERMRTLHDHSTMMEGITDQKQLAEELEKHTRMLSEMMEQMTKAEMGPAPGQAEGETP